MKELVALAERREAACKAEVSQLLANRSAMYEAGNAAHGSAAAAAPLSTAVAEAEAAAEAAEAEAQAQAAAAEGSLADEEDVPSAEAAAAKIAEAERRMDVVQVGHDSCRRSEEPQGWRLHVPEYGWSCSVLVLCQPVLLYRWLSTCPTCPTCPTRHIRPIRPQCLPRAYMQAALNSFRM